MALAGVARPADHLDMMDSPQKPRRALCVAFLCASLATSAHTMDSPCTAAVHHALDFWLGEWSVRSGEEIVATSRIDRSPLGCAIVESYRQNDGFSGTSLSFYDPVLKRWRQTWVDSAGGAGEFTGDPAPNALHFTGETHRADGTRIQRRMTLTAEGAHVRQVSFASRDGVQWQPHYDFVYVRR